MKELLGLEDSVFISIVCFANRTKFKVKTHSDREFVVHTNDLRSTVLDHPQCMGPDVNAVADSSARTYPGFAEHAFRETLRELVER